jgi:ribosomal protein S18 acetylase RimI-like enzyme
MLRWAPKSMAEPVLRRATAADADKLSLLGQATFLTAFAHDHPGDALIAHCRDQHSQALYAAWAEDPDYALWLIETELGAPIGYAALTPPAIDIPVADGDLELKRIYALSGWQNAGLGRRLMDAAIAEARARGARRLYLCVYQINVGAQRFYARLGFERVGKQDFRVGDVVFHDWILALDL